MMISTLFRIRMAQGIRWLKSIGPVYALLVLLSFFLLMNGMRILMLEDKDWMVAVGFFFLLFLIHFSRPDHRFLRIMIPDPRPWMMVEYILALTPVLFLWMWSPNPWHFCFPLAGTLILPFFPYAHRTGSKARKVFWFRPTEFEWLGGIRGKFFESMGVTMLVLISCLFPFGILVGNLLAVALIGSFFQVGESRLMLESFFKSPGAFLKSKWIALMKRGIVFFGLVHGIALVIHPETWYLILPAFLYTLTVLTYFLFTKYAYYFPGEEPGGQQVTSILVVLSLAIPFLTPLPIVYCIRNYRKAHSNLKRYLNDFHT